jgi:CRP-like cAMP-binding protein
MFCEDLMPLSFFPYLTEKNLYLIRSHCKELSHPEGAVILHQDEQSFDLYYR